MCTTTVRPSTLKPCVTVVLALLWAVIEDGRVLLIAGLRVPLAQVTLLFTQTQSRMTGSSSISQVANDGTGSRGEVEMERQDPRQARSWIGVELR